MLDNIIIVFKGIIIGIGKIIPGVSGSMLAILLNVYEKAIYSISNIFKNFKENILFLGLLGIGILISIIIGSNILLFFLDKYYFLTFSFIIGLILGTIPSFLKNIKIDSKNDLIYLIIPFCIIYIFSHIKFNYYLSSNNLIYLFLGLLEAFTTIVPGISSTAIYMSFGLYNKFLNVFSNIFSLRFILFSIGLFIGVFITSKIINLLFKKHRNKTYIIILSILLGSILILIKGVLNLYDFNIIKFFLFLVIGFVISKVLNK